MFGIIVSLLALVSVTRALRPLFLPCGHGQLTFSNECAIHVEKAVVSFGKNTVELNDIPPRGKSTEHFFVRDDCTCRVVVTLADGLVISNSYGYYCYGMDCGTVDVTVTKDKRVKIVDMYYKENIENTCESSKLMSERTHLKSCESCQNGHPRTRTKGTETMKPFVRIMLFASCLSFAAGCSNSMRDSDDSLAESGSSSWGVER